MMLSRYTANVLNRPVTAGPIEATAIGNVMSQLIALKEVEDLQQAREIIKRSFPTEEYLPQDSEQWDEAYNRYKDVIVDSSFKALPIKCSFQGSGLIQ